MLNIYSRENNFGRNMGFGFNKDKNNPSPPLDESTVSRPERKLYYDY